MPQGDIKLYLLDNAGGKLSKSTGTKIEYSVSDETEFSRRLSIKARKKLMQKLIQKEEEEYQAELDNMGRSYWKDTVPVSVRRCTKEHLKPPPAILSNAQKTHCEILFKVFSD